MIFEDGQVKIWTLVLIVGMGNSNPNGELRFQSCRTDVTSNPLQILPLMTSHTFKTDFETREHHAQYCTELEYLM
jgi:hypothetical protein